MDALTNLDDFINGGMTIVLNQGLRRAALVVVADAKMRCPVEDGQLRQSIDSEVNDLEAIIGTNVEYAPYVEIGTGIYSLEGTGRQTPWVYRDAKGNYHTTKGQKPQPFLKPAVENNKQRIVEQFRELL